MPVQKVVTTSVPAHKRKTGSDANMRNGKSEVKHSGGKHRLLQGVQGHFAVSHDTELHSRGSRHGATVCGGPVFWDAGA
ncbi:hypothetical protein EVAR_27772_1 [Eumeta japonica]|uniref:Uncharacterized protein n=1 Tax=Eumeta variegata TaxID=151549 RepID=A0A4C1VAL0_EUMVA|nr:hypothetical protein EVAR_27772_1 [Eumeta japonica]